MLRQQTDLPASVLSVEEASTLHNAGRHGAERRRADEDRVFRRLVYFPELCRDWFESGRAGEGEDGDVVVLAEGNGGF